MKLLEPFWIALATYSALPCPIFDWNEDNMRYSICYFPLVGIPVAVAEGLWYWLCGKLCVGAALFAAVATVIPILVTGGIHMDGFMDTMDALSSHRERERKLEILKDSHCGAFAVLFCCVYLLATYGFLSVLYEGDRLPVVLLGYVLSRSLSTYTVLTMKNARGSGMLKSFQQPNQGKKAKLSVLALFAAAAAAELFLFRIPGGFAVAGAVLTLFWYRKKTMKEFGGVTGDTSGFFLQICELMILVFTWIGSML